MHELFDVVRLFQEANVRFVLIGGLAIVAHGGTHFTNDADFSFALDDENCEKIIELLSPYHPRPLAWLSSNPFPIKKSHLQQMRFLNLKTDIGDIDLLPLPAGIDSFEGLWERGRDLDLGGFLTRVASLDDLIAMKQAAGRPKDTQHLMEIYALKRVVAEEETS